LIRIKICGITRLEDALLAEALGAFAVGFVFAPGSRRRVDLEVARTISEALGPFVVRVGVFQNQGPEEVLGLRNGPGSRWSSSMARSPRSGRRPLAGTFPS
jgi:phosphoribosylanthranilate isomerase